MRTIDLLFDVIEFEFIIIKIFEKYPITFEQIDNDGSEPIKSVYYTHNLRVIDF